MCVCVCVYIYVCVYICVCVCVCVCVLGVTSHFCLKKIGGLTCSDFGFFFLFFINSGLSVWRCISWVVIGKNIRKQSRVRALLVCLLKKLRVRLTRTMCVASCLEVSCLISFFTYKFEGSATFESVKNSFRSVW